MPNVALHEKRLTKRHSKMFVALQKKKEEEDEEREKKFFLS